MCDGCRSPSLWPTGRPIFAFVSTQHVVSWVCERCLAEADAIGGQFLAWILVNSSKAVECRELSTVAEIWFIVNCFSDDDLIRNS